MFNLDYFGLSAYSLEDFFNVKKKYNLNLIQVPYNILDRQIEKQINLFNKQIKIQVRSIFLQGALLAKYKDLNKYFYRWKPIFQNWEAWLKKNNLTHLEGCLSLIQNNSNVDQIIIGVNSHNQLNDIISILKYELPRPPIFLTKYSKYLVNPSYFPIP